MKLSCTIGSHATPRAEDSERTKSSYIMRELAFATPLATSNRDRVTAGVQEQHTRAASDAIVCA